MTHHRVGRDNKLTYDNEPTSCETKTFSVCSVTAFTSVSVTGTVTTTVTKSTSKACQTGYGCEGKDKTTTTSTATTTTAACKATQVVSDTPPPQGCPANAVVYPNDNYKLGQIPTILANYTGKYKQISTDDDGYVSFIWVPWLDEATMEKLQSSVRYFSESSLFFSDINSSSVYSRMFLRHTTTSSTMSTILMTTTMPHPCMTGVMLSMTRASTLLGEHLRYRIALTKHI